MALVLGGGAARGLAHLGVLEVLEAERVRTAFLAGASIGGLVAALAARGLAAGPLIEVALDRQRALAIAMTGPEVLIDLDLGDVSFRDFHRLVEIVEIGRRATRDALPQLRAALSSAAAVPRRPPGELAMYIDPVCRMAVSPARARASVVLDDVPYYFCSVNCRECFVRHGERYLRMQSKQDPQARVVKD